MVYSMRYCVGVNVRGKPGFGEQLGGLQVQRFSEAPACEEHELPHPAHELLGLEAYTVKKTCGNVP